MKYRKPDQYYDYEHDRQTIALLKKIKKEYKDPSGDEEIVRQNRGVEARFVNTAILQAQGKDNWIAEQIYRDEYKDRMLELNPVPSGIKCNKCRSLMNCDKHLFRNDTDLLFIFHCPNGHLPNKAICPNGSEYFFPKMRCEVCGYELQSKFEQKEDMCINIDTCTGCGKVTTFEWDLKEEPEAPITEEERDKYCKAYKGRRTYLQSFVQDLTAIDNFLRKYGNKSSEQEQPEAISIQVETLSISQLEKKLIIITGSLQLEKLQLGKPELGRYVIVEFTVQDPLDRNGADIAKMLANTVKKEFFTTNWRLMSTGVTCRLGILTGQLKGYETEEDIKKIAEQVRKRG